MAFLMVVGRGAECRSLGYLVQGGERRSVFSVAEVEWRSRGCSQSGASITGDQSGNQCFSSRVEGSETSPGPLSLVRGWGW